MKDLPPTLGAFQIVKRRYYRWLEHGLIDRLFEQLDQDADLEWLLFDNTVIRAHQHAASAPKKKGRQKAQGLGRSRVGFSTKLHAAADALSNPSCRPLAGPGQENDMARGHRLINGIKSGDVLANRADDADCLIDAILDTGAEPVIPPRCHRKHQHDYDKATLYKERNVIEKFLAKLKQLQRVATCYGQRLTNFTGFVKIAAIAIILR